MKKFLIGLLSRFVITLTWILFPILGFAYMLSFPIWLVVWVLTGYSFYSDDRLIEWYSDIMFGDFKHRSYDGY